MTWSAAQYVKFEGERTRAVRDLLAAVPNTDADVRAALDIGCGPGNSTEVLAARFPEAAIIGIDSSPDMIAAAHARLPRFAFEVASVETWAPAAASLDVILANAVFQWVPDHAALLPRLVTALAPGGSLAIQMPDNLDEPAHRLMREVAADPRWAAKLGGAARTERYDARWYYELLRPRCARVDVWRTTYHHPLADADAIVEWFKGSGLRPFLEALGDDDRAEYLARYRAEIARAYPAMADGGVLLPFPRVFVVATR